MLACNGTLPSLAFLYKMNEIIRSVRQHWNEILIWLNGIEIKYESFFNIVLHDLFTIRQDWKDSEVMQRKEQKNAPKIASKTNNAQ